MILDQQYAVANYSDALARLSGNVVVYHKAKGYPEFVHRLRLLLLLLLRISVVKGNLFVDGLNDYGENFKFGELAKGSDGSDDILLPNTVRFPGGIEWDGRCTSQSGTVAGAGDLSIYVQQRQGYLEGTTPLDGIGIFGQLPSRA